MPRLFLAVDLPDAHKVKLAGLRDEALPGRWTRPAHYHLTLRFIGEADEARASTIEHALGGIHAEAFTLRGRGLGVFPSTRKPRVLFAAIDPVPALMDLQAKIEQTLRTLGLEAEPKPFHPHITLTRLRQARAQTVRAYLRTHRTFTLDPFEVAYFYLYTSLLRPEGALYERRARFPLSENLLGFAEPNN